MNSEEPTGGPFRTSDLDLAAFLSARGFRLRAVEPPEPGTYPPHAAFIFDKSEALTSAVEDWENRHDEEVLVDVADFARTRSDFYRRAREAADGGEGR